MNLTEKIIEHIESGACYEVCSQPQCEISVTAGNEEVEHWYMFVAKSMETNRFHLFNLNDLVNYFREF